METIIFLLILVLWSVIKPKKTNILLKNLNTLKDNDYKAFGVSLPKKVILEVFSFGEKHQDKFSNLVKKYPFAQLVASQWFTIKLYERHKFLTNNPNLDYEDFLKNFISTFNHKSYNLIDALNKLQFQEINARYNINFNIIDTATALNVSNTDYITLYDIIYDIIPNSIRNAFINNENKLKAYLPLNQEQFFYQEIEYENPKDVFNHLYGEDTTYDEEKVPKEFYTMNALFLEDYKLDSIIAKAKMDKLGIGYDELLEFINHNETNLEYPEVYKFKWITLPEDCLVEDGKFYGCTPIYKIVFDIKYKANYENIVALSRTSNKYDILFVSQGEVHDDEEVSHAIIRQYYQARAFLVQNNFFSQNLIFESFRMKLEENEEFKKQAKNMAIIFHGEYPETNPYWYAWIVQSNAYLAYRFNQALTLAFLNAYGGK